MKILIRNVKIVSSENVIKGNILIEDNIFTKVGDFSIIETDIDEIIDGDGCFALPGFIDFHVHLDDDIGEFYIADTYSSGTKKALKNGITTLMTFVTQSKSNSLKESLKKSIGKTVENLYCDVGYHLSPITFEKQDFDDIKDLINQGFRTFKFYTTYKKAGIYSDYQIIENFIKHFRNEKIRILVHCEDDKILQTAYNENSQKEGHIFHAKSRPKSAEIFAIKKMIELSEKYNYPIHIVHVTCAESVELLEVAKSVCPITYETGMQYLYFDEEVYNQDNANYHFCTPPFRNKENVRKMKEFALNDKFDIFATDHCPFTIEDKDKYKNHDSIPNGLPGLEFFPQMAFNLFDEISDKNLSLICKKMSENPAKLIDQFPQKGIIQENSFADLVLCRFGSDKQLEGDAKVFNPYQNFKSNLIIDKVFFKGINVISDSKFIDGEQHGELIINQMKRENNG